MSANIAKQVSKQLGLVERFAKLEAEILDYAKATLATQEATLEAVRLLAERLGLDVAECDVDPADLPGVVSGFQSLDAGAPGAQPFDGSIQVYESPPKKRGRPKKQKPE